MSIMTYPRRLILTDDLQLLTDCWILDVSDYYHMSVKPGDKRLGRHLVERALEYEVIRRHLGLRAFLRSQSTVDTKMS